MELKDLVGKHWLDAVDFTNEQIKETYGDRYEDSSVCRFRLDGVVYVAAEDPGDGYRSSMRELTVQDNAKLDNVFPAIEVIGRHRDKSGYDADDILEIIDAVTGKIVLEVGTTRTDDYYPSFVACFSPENMATNAAVGVPVPANDNTPTPAPYSHAAAINIFAADCHAASRKAGWYTDLATGKALDRNVPEMLCLIHSEISEAMEGYRKSTGGKVKMDDKLPHRPNAEVELADAMIRIGDLATFLGFDLGGAIVEKMAFNASREDHKIENRRAAGGKAF